MKTSRRIRALAAVLLAGTLVAPLAARSAPSAATTTVYRTISTQAPAWYTRDLQRQVVAAGARGLTIPKEYAIPTSSLAFLGIRPGQLIIVFNPNGFSLCTSNFVFRNGSNYAIGTAGHCGNVGDQVSMLTAPRVLVDIGSITKSTSGGVGNDFALISIKPALNSIVSPSMAFWGGPAGAHKGSSVPLIVEHIGWGLVIGTGGTPRVGVGVSYSTAGLWRFEGAITPGDSGSGAIDANGGRAVGNITHLAYNLLRSPFVWEAGTSIPRILVLAGLPLATCPAIPWPLYGCPKL